MSRIFKWSFVFAPMVIAGCGATAGPTPPVAKTPVVAVSQAPAGTEQEGKPDDKVGSKDEKNSEGKADLSRENLLEKVSAAISKGMQLAEDKKSEEAHKSFHEGGAGARELIKRFSPLTEEEQAIAAGALYNDACGLALSGSAAPAFAALKEAFGAGFPSTDLLDDDADLATVRALPEFAAWRKELDAKLAAQAVEEVKKELAEFKSYPFDFKLPDLDDKAVKLSDFAGKVVIVDIWGTWCPPCRAEIPSFIKL